jgi:hypothetical protein
VLIVVVVVFHYNFNMFLDGGGGGRYAVVIYIHVETFLSSMVCVYGAECVYSFCFTHLRKCVLSMFYPRTRQAVEPALIVDLQATLIIP